MGKAAGAYYNELKASGLPEDIAIKMTQEYMRTFTNLGELFKNVSRFDRHGKGNEKEDD
jgi:hypothetical protein